MSKMIDLTGNKYGRLTVLKKDKERITKSGSYWICQCECGKIKSIRSSSLRNGDIVSCGCYRMEKIMATKEKNGLIDSIERAKNDVENDNKKENDKINNYENSNSGDKLHSIDNLIGQQFGFLTVLSKDPERTKDGAVKWVCKCVCGNTISVRGNSLKCKTENRTISCGCTHISFGELKIKNILDENNIIYSQE